MQHHFHGFMIEDNLRHGMTYADRVMENAMRVLDLAYYDLNDVCKTWMEWCVGFGYINGKTAQYIRERKTVMWVMALHQ